MKTVIGFVREFIKARVGSFVYQSKFIKENGRKTTCFLLYILCNNGTVLTIHHASLLPVLR